MVLHQVHLSVLDAALAACSSWDRHNQIHCFPTFLIVNRRHFIVFTAIEQEMKSLAGREGQPQEPLELIATCGMQGWLDSGSDSVAEAASIAVELAIRSAKDRYSKLGRLTTYQAAFTAVVVMNQVYWQETKNTRNNFSEFVVVIFGNYFDCQHIVAPFSGQVNVTCFVDLAKLMAK